jgi:hypothetical protein
MAILHFKTFPDPDVLEALAGIDRLSRRDFIKFGLAAGALASVGAAALRPLDAWAALPPGIKFMSEAEHKVFARLLEVMLPVGGSALVPLKDIPVLQTLDAALLGTMEPHILQGLKKGIAYFNDGPQSGFGKRFVDLDDAQAARFCDAWAGSAEVPQRALAMGLKKLVGLAYWANPPTWAPLGYDGPVSKSWGLKSLGNAPMPKH